MGMAYNAEAPDVLPDAESFAAEILADDGLQEVDLVARMLLGDEDHHVRPFVLGAGIIWKTKGETQ